MPPAVSRVKVADNEGSTTITAELVELSDSFSLSVLAQPASGGGGGGGSGGSSGSSTTPPAEEADEEEGEAEKDKTEPEADDADSVADDELQPESDVPDKIDEETPGFGFLVGLVALLSVATLGPPAITLSASASDRQNSTSRLTPTR